MQVLGISVQMVSSSGGVFEVWINEKLIYSKKDLIGCDSPRFPHEGEIANFCAAIKEAQNASS